MATPRLPVAAIDCQPSARAVRQPAQRRWLAGRNAPVWFHGEMPSLLDRPSDNALHLLRIIANGYAEASGNWPFWKWVALDR